MGVDNLRITNEDIIQTKSEAFRLGMFSVLGLTEKQTIAMRLLCDGHTTRLMYGGAAGGGKAQPLDAMVLTPFGFRPMGSINVGSIVMHPSGANQRVIAVHPQGVKDIYRVSFNDGSSTECCGEHIWQYYSFDLKKKLLSTNRLIPLIDKGFHLFTPYCNPSLLPKDSKQIGIGRQITSIELIGQKEAKCITVEEIDGLYITDDFIVTHNSFLGCEWLFWNCITYPNTRWFVARSQLTLIRDSTVVTMNKVFRKHGYPSDLVRYDSVSVKFTFPNGSVIKGLETVARPSDKDFDRLGSTEYTGGWIEEAAQVNADAYYTLCTRIGRHMNTDYNLLAKVLITSNPSKNWIYKIFYKPFKDASLPIGHVFMQAFVADNTKIDDGYQDNLESLVGEKRQRLLLGNFDYDSDPDQLAHDDAIADMFTNSFVIEDKNRKCLVVDAAMYGSDLFRVGYFEGDVLVEHGHMAKSGGKDIINLIEKFRRKYSIPSSSIVYDADGVGAFIGGNGGFITGAISFNGGTSPVIRTPEDKKYFDLKSQCAFLLCEDINEYRVHAKGVTEPQDIETLSEELAYIRKMQGIDKMRIISKDEVKRGIGRSPDFSDIFVMKKYFDILPRIKRHNRQVQ